jgi:hypothetical protein
VFNRSWLQFDKGIKMALETSKIAFFSIESSRSDILKPGGGFGDRFLSVVHKVCEKVKEIFTAIKDFFCEVILRREKALSFDDDISPKRIVIQGDIHGELDGLKENLIDAGVIDKNDNWIAPKGTVVTQMGDVIDRGPKSRESMVFLRKLQKKAEKKGSQVIRLLGNHEWMLLQGKDFYANFSDPKKLAEEIREDILLGRIRLAYHDGERLYTHAGVRTKVREEIRSKIAIERQCHISEVSHKDVATSLNESIMEMARQDNFPDEDILGWVGKERGGMDLVGGPLWGDDQPLKGSPRALKECPQVIAHNPPLAKRKEAIDYDEETGFLNVDAGLCEIYGGNRAYVTIEDPVSLDQHVVIHEKKEGEWKEREIFKQRAFKVELEAPILCLPERIRMVLVA